MFFSAVWKLLKYRKSFCVAVLRCPAILRSDLVKALDPVACMTRRPSRASSPSRDNATTDFPVPGPPDTTMTRLLSAWWAFFTWCSTRRTASCWRSRRTNSSRSWISAAAWSRSWRDGANEVLISSSAGAGSQTGERRLLRYSEKSAISAPVKSLESVVVTRSSSSAMSALDMALCRNAAPWTRSG